MTTKKTLKKAATTAQKKTRTAHSIVPDTSVLAEGLVTKYLAQNKITTNKIIIPEAVLNELEHQANQGRETGYIGLDEIKALQKKRGLRVEFRGERPGEFEIKFAKSGAVDHLIREIARKEEATLMTADRVQALVAEAMNIRVEFIKFSFDKKKLHDPLKKYFDKTTMSVHLKEDTQVIAKKGRPGDWKFTKTQEKPDYKKLQELAKDIVETAQQRPDGYIEIERPGSTIVQLGRYRIVIAKPPFASTWEITAVRPVVHLKLEDYDLPEKFRTRLEEKAEGILVAGSPGEGKSTFTQALGEHYANQEKIVKTVEAPRDLVLPDTITQYSATHGTPEEIRDVLLLNRPDYTIYDEIRNTKDFQLFSDMRLAGVGMIGVVHAAEAVDAIQRFIGRIELGMIPQVVDTVVFIKAGAPAKVYTIEMQVKTPAGMTEADLARPVVIIKDFYTGKPEYEIYTYGDQTTVVPVTGKEHEQNPAQRLAAQAVEQYFHHYTSRVQAEFLSENKVRVYVPDSKIPMIIGKGGSNIEEIQTELGVNIDVQSIDQKKHAPRGGDVTWQAFVGKKNVTIDLTPRYSNAEVDIYDGKSALTSATASKSGQISFSLNSKEGRRVRKALDRDTLEVYG